MMRPVVELAAPPSAMGMLRNTWGKSIVWPGGLPASPIPQALTLVDVAFLPDESPRILTLVIAIKWNVSSPSDQSVLPAGSGRPQARVILEVGAGGGSYTQVIDVTRGKVITVLAHTLRVSLTDRTSYAGGP